MSVCSQCGHALGIGRFCTNCGHPVAARPATDDWRTGTAERPAVSEVPGEPRYPLYADEAGGTDDPRRRPGPRPGTGGLLPWLVGALTLLLLAGAGIWLLAGDGGDDGPAAPDRVPGPSAGSGGGDRSPGAGPGSSGEPGDVAASATARVPATAPPNQDLAGNLVRYEAANMLDGRPVTCWRMPGDGTGELLTFELAENTRLTSVGVVNGYAKTARVGGTTFDWYRGNRRVMAVEWVFEDGTTVTQQLATTRELQVLDLDGVVTGSVGLRLVEVSPPGPGPAGRNYTPISEVSLVGAPA